MVYAETSVAVLLSREIAPYTAMLEGLEQGLGAQRVVRFFFDEKGRTYSLEARNITLAPENYAAVVAVGPEALRYLHPRAGDTPLIFGMVLRPHNVIESHHPPLCGVELEIPVETQLEQIRQLYPAIRNVGIFFDPANNQAWFDQAQKLAGHLGFMVRPLFVNRTRSGLNLVGDFNQVDVALFIPDQTIISQAVIQYIIKEALQRQLPVIGFNRFFLDSGAAHSFIVDYRQIGYQVAGLVNRHLQGQCRQVIPPYFRTKTHDRVLKLLHQTGAGGER